MPPRTASAVMKECRSWVIFDRDGGFCLLIDVRFAPKGTQLLRGS